MDILAKVYEALYQCNKCGFCQATCTTYRHLWDETYTARGRIRLILAVADGQLARTPAYEEAINTCLTCHQCAVTCPSGVKGDDLILAARQDLFEKRGMPLIKKIPLQRVLPYRGRRNMTFRAFRLFKGLLPATFRGIDLRGMPVAARSFTSSAASVYRPEGQPKFRVAYFVGCMTDHTLPGVAAAVVKVLVGAGAEVVVPKEQECCGLPMYTYGDMATARQLASKNLALMESLQVDAIITACGSCGGMLHQYGALFADQPEAARAAQFSAKTYDVIQFIMNELKLAPVSLGPLSVRVTYHDSCHLARGMGVTKEPRTLLKAIPELEFVEMKDADQCCGAAGLLQGLYPQLATQITKNKVKNVQATRADYVAVDCPACLHRIQGGLNQSGGGPQAAHIVEILAAAMEAAAAIKLVR